MIPFNSRDKNYKNKFGAIAQGETLCLRVFLAKKLNSTSAWLVIHRDDRAEWGFIEMKNCATKTEDAVCWEVYYTPDSPGLYWYHFEYDTPWGRSGIHHIGGGLGEIINSGEDWQLTVYSKDFSTPDWLKGGIIYQIFPDRFAKSSKLKQNVPTDRILRSDWGGLPHWQPNEKGEILNNDYFCGDIKGIEEKLDYIAELGVNCIYLNPIFEAHSNHRYDTADYMSVDPLLGSVDDFKSLCLEAEKRGIKIILDGVFSHTGADSIYFNKNDRYNSIGAYNSTDSPYYPWYKFRSCKDDYDCWWGIEILPEVKEESPEFIEFINGEKGVVRKWLSYGASGWRLDVADELPNVFLDALRKAVKAENPDALILGEVWEDASNKYSYGERRRYLLGEQLDSVMNYPFSTATLEFVRTGNVDGFMDKVLTILENYPPAVINIMMNHIGTHDTQRAITYLGGEWGAGRDRKWQAEKVLTAEQRQRGIELLKIATAIQYTLPGVPSIYYGDEAGMDGYNDPFNRGCYPWGEENQELLAWYKDLGKLRNSCEALIDGAFVPISAASGCLAFARIGENSSLMTIANRNEHEITYYLPEDWHNARVALGGEKIDKAVIIQARTTSILIRGF